MSASNDKKLRQTIRRVTKNVAREHFTSDVKQIIDEQKRLIARYRRTARRSLAAFIVAAVCAVAAVVLGVM